MAPNNTKGWDSETAAPSTRTSSTAVTGTVIRNPLIGHLIRGGSAADVPLTAVWATTCVPQLIGFLVLVGGCCGLSDVFGVVTHAQSHSDTIWV
ncbi:hypothetical protein GCM10022275_19730 [Tessaracoccus defluvii]